MNQAKRVIQPMFMSEKLKGFFYSNNAATILELEYAWCIVFEHFISFRIVSNSRRKNKKKKNKKNIKISISFEDLFNSFSYFFSKKKLKILVQINQKLFS